MLVEYVKKTESSKELLDQMWKALQKQYDNIDIRIYKKEKPAFDHLIDNIRRRKLDKLSEKAPDLDKRTFDVFAHLSHASQLIVKGGIDSQVVSSVKASASYMVSNLLGSEATVDTLSRMIICDPTLYDHSASVAMFASVIAKSMMSKPFGNKETALVAQCGLYHDIGKTCVPNHILNKPGRFTKEEFEVMKSHTSLGHDELQKVIDGKADIDPVCAIVAHEHHEKFDGSGYPCGKKGRKEDDEDNGIHLYARIVSIADVYSALLMKRVYKPAYSSQDAIKIMAESAARDFDPEIFPTFVRSVVKSLNIYEEKRANFGRILQIGDDGKIRELKNPNEKKKRNA